MRRCDWCWEELDQGRYIVVEEEVFCHHVDWITPEGTCYERYIVNMIPELEEWLNLCWECDGCISDEEGECTCTSDGWKLDP